MQTIPSLLTNAGTCYRALPTLGTALVLLVTSACAGDEPVPTSAIAVTSSAIAAPVATRLGDMNAPVVRITDRKGRPMRNLLVRWKVTSGGGSVVNDSARTTPTGEASSGGWNLGTTAGQQTLQATVDGVAPVVFTATAVPGPIAELTPVTTTFSTTVVNQPVAPAPAVRARDAYGNLVPGGQVVFALAQAQGTLTGETQATTADGVATLPGWRLGTTAGTQSIRVTAGTAPTVSITVTAQPGPPTKFIPLTFTDITSVASVAAGTTPSLRVADAFNNGVPNVAVTWSPGTNSGSVTTPASPSSATGIATPGSWLLGSAATQTLTASSAAIPGASLGFTARTVTTQFDIDVRFVGAGGTEIMREAFRSAATRWRSVISGDVHTNRLEARAGACASWQPAVDVVVNDVLIFARIAPIDGLNNILARAGPCYIDDSTRLTVAGIMEFDEVDLPGLIANGGIVDVITHEMGHVLGIGTLWNYGGRTLLVNAGAMDPYFQGTAARAGFAAVNTVVFSGTPVPVENSGGSGTRDSHWREATFARELMTGFYNGGVINPLSRVTVGSLADLGYQVNISAAEPFSITALLYTFPYAPGASAIPLVDDLTSTPLYELRNGRAVLLRPAR